MKKIIKVLVVDDNKEGRLLLSKLLTSNNYEVNEVCNGIKALEYLKVSKPDLIISDILMPEMDGFTLLRELNKNTGDTKIPVVFYSAHYVNEKDKQLAEKLGASRFIVKPSEPKDILKEIKTVLTEFESTDKKQVKPALSTNEDYLGEYAECVFMKLEDKVRELEQEITERKQVETKLKESMESYRSLFNNSPISLWEEDFSEIKKYIEGLRNKGIKEFRKYFQEHPEEMINCANMLKITDVNRATLQLYEAGNKEELMAGFGKVFGEESYKAIREELIALAQDKVLYESEAINYTLSGRKIHVILKWSVAPGYEMNFKKVLVSILDITQRKNAEEKIEASLKEKEILLREIHHRVKNNMQIISSLLGLASETITDKKYVDMFRESQNRINSMSLIHEKLYRSRDLAKIDLKEYIVDLVYAIFQSRGVRKGTIGLNLNIENVLLGIDHSIPLGLIINELITNSLKYAFPGDTKGEIGVSLHLIDEDTFELIVSDNGVGIPDAVDFRKTESLGLRLVILLVENQLKGMIDLDRSKGTEFIIKFRGR